MPELCKAQPQLVFAFFLVTFLQINCKKFKSFRDWDLNENVVVENVSKLTTRTENNEIVPFPVESHANLVISEDFYIFKCAANDYEDTKYVLIRSQLIFILNMHY